MKRPALIVKSSFFAVIVTVAALAFPRSAWAAAAGQPQVCHTTSCTINEFLSTNLYLSNAASFFQSNAKNKILGTSVNDVAVATWSYSNRSLSIFSNFLSDAWTNASKSFVKPTGNENKPLVAINPLTPIATVSANVLGAKSEATISGNIFNKSIVDESFGDGPSLQTKIQQTEGSVVQLFADSQYAESKIGLAKLRWNTFDEVEILDTVQDISKKLGGENDPSSSNSIFGQISFLSDSWDWNSIVTVKAQAKGVREALISVQNEVQTSGRSPVALNRMGALTSLLSQLNNSIGDESSKPTQETLFGKLKETKQIALSLDERSKEVSSLLFSWGSFQPTDQQNKLNDLTKNVATVNRIPGVNRVILGMSTVSEKELKNKGYSLLGVINANKKMLAGKTGLPLVSTWMESGSIIFKSLVSNPSPVLSQNISLKYYLPAEIKQENIIEVDPSVSVKLDPDNGQYFVTGEFFLSPSESKTVSVRVADVWVIDDKELASLRMQAVELSKPLERTSYFVQGVTLKSDIDVSLNKIASLSNNKDEAPEARIKSGREAQSELKSVQEKVNELKDLNIKATTMRPTFELKGVNINTQTAAAGGLVLIFLIGVVYLFSFLRSLTKKVQPATVPAEEKTTAKAVVTKSRFNFGSFIILTLSVSMGLAVGLAIGRTSLSIEAKAQETTSDQSIQPQTQDLPSEVLNQTSEQSSPSATVKLYVPLNAYINVRSESEKKSPVVTKIKETSELVMLGQENGWLKVRTASNDEGWVSGEFAKQ